MRLKLHEAIVTAQIVNHPGQAADGGDLTTLENGVIAGRVDTPEAVMAVIEFRDEGKKPICAYQDTYKQITNLLCPSRDMPKTGSGGHNAVCESSSFTAGFQAVPANAVSGGTLDFDAGCLPYDPTCPPGS